MISELYMNKEAVVRIAGVSPLLFSIYAEMIMKEALENVEEGIRVGGELIKDVKYADADDQGMVTNTEA